VVKLQSWKTTRSSKKWDPSTMRGSQGRCCQATGSHDHARYEGCHLWW
jgi:hypothetical protein